MIPPARSPVDDALDRLVSIGWLSPEEAQDLATVRRSLEQLREELDEYAERLAWHREERDAYLKGNLWVTRAAEEQSRAEAAEAELERLRWEPDAWSQRALETVMAWKRRVENVERRLFSAELLLDPEREDEPDEENALRAFEVLTGLRPPTYVPDRERAEAAEAEVQRLTEGLRGVANAYGCFAGCTGGLPGAPVDGSGHTPACAAARALLSASPSGGGGA